MKKKPMVRVKKRGKAMSDDEIKAILRAARASTVSYTEGTIVDERRKGLQYYRGDKFGNEMRGRSQVVSRDVLDTIETVMPELMEVFIASDAVVQFKPTNEDDEEMAEQATDYCNYVFLEQNEGFMILLTWMKDALIQKNGMAKVVWEDTEKKKTQRLRGLSIIEVMELMNDENVQIEEQKAYMVQPDPAGGEGIEMPVDDAMEDSMDEQALMNMRYDLKVCYYSNKGKNVIYNIPPEEFLISPRARDIIAPDICCHEVEKTASELIQTYPKLKNLIDGIGGWSTNQYGSEKNTRFQDESFSNSTMSVDRSTRKILTSEWYVFMDADGDGVAELRRIVTAGENIDEILENEDDVDENPFVDICPYPEPHKFHGQSLADLVMDIQLIKSTIMRQLLDNMYQTNNQRYEVVESMVNMDDVLDSKPNGVVRTKAKGMITPIVTPSLSGDGLGMLEKLDQVREQRTGVQRSSRGLDVDRLHDTAEGISKLMDKLDKRTMLIARIFAEMGMKRLFKKIVNNLIKYQDKELTFRLRGKWVKIDPRTWHADMDASAQVGLGTGTPEEIIMRVKDMLLVQQQAYAANPASVTPDNAWNSLKDYVKASGKKNPELYFTDPKGPNYKPPQPQKDPKIIEKEMDMQFKREELAEKMKLEREKMNLEHQLGQQKLSIELLAGKKTPAVKAGGNVGV